MTGFFDEQRTASLSAATASAPRPSRSRAQPAKKWPLPATAVSVTDEPGGEPDRQFLAQTISTLRAMGQEAFLASRGVT